MDYVDWVERVLHGLAQAWDEAPADSRVSSGVNFQAVGIALGFDAKQMEVSTPGEPALAVLYALRDLEDLGIVSERLPGWYRWTQQGRETLQTGISEYWEPLVSQFLESEQLEVVNKLAEMCQEDHGTYVWLREVSPVHVAEALGMGWDRERVYQILLGLKHDLHMAQFPHDYNRAIPTYRSLVCVTRKVDTEWQSIIRGLLPDWETTNVDFKQQLNLKRNEEKAEFVKDILALVNTKSSGRRLMVIGFDSKTHRFKMSVDPSINIDRIEDILNAYAEPIPKVQYHAVGWDGGMVGVVEIFREVHKLPYKVKNDLAHITPGDVYVRRGSRNTKLDPGDEEYLDLVAERDSVK